MRLPEDITDVFRAYYDKLCNISSHPQHAIHPDYLQKIRDYLVAYGFPRLPDQTLQVIEAPITPDKLAAALPCTHTGKSAGPDGLSISYYKKLGVEWTLHFLRASNSVGDGT